MEFLIDREGEPTFSWDVTTRVAVWEHGLIHVGKVVEIVVVSFAPSLTQGVTLAGAFDEIARLDPSRLCLRTDPASPNVEVFCRYADAFHRMWDLAANAGNVKAYSRGSVPSSILTS